MTFTKASVIGFAVGFVAAVGVSMIRIPRPGFLISADKKERLNKKQAAARLNDANEDIDMHFEIWLAPEKDPVALLQNIRLKALVDPRWAKLLTMYEEKMNK